MSDAPSGGQAGLLLVIFGLWLLGQTIVGGLVGRLLGLANSSGSNSSSSGPSLAGSVESAVGQAAGGVAGAVTGMAQQTAGTGIPGVLDTVSGQLPPKPPVSSTTGVGALQGIIGQAAG